MKNLQIGNRVYINAEAELPMDLTLSVMSKDVIIVKEIICEDEESATVMVGTANGAETEIDLPFHGEVVSGHDRVEIHLINGDWSSVYEQ